MNAPPTTSETFALDLMLVASLASTVVIAVDLFVTNCDQDTDEFMPQDRAAALAAFGVILDIVAKVGPKDHIADAVMRLMEPMGDEQRWETLMAAVKARGDQYDDEPQAQEEPHE